MLAIKNTIGFLRFADKANDVGDLLVGYVGLWRHVSKPPMMLGTSLFSGSVKSVIPMVAGVINIVNEWRPFVGSGRIYPVTFGAGAIERYLPFDGSRRKPGYFYSWFQVGGDLTLGHWR